MSFGPNKFALIVRDVDFVQVFLSPLQIFTNNNLHWIFAYDVTNVLHLLDDLLFACLDFSRGSTRFLNWEEE
jgi:hypothetical protein